MSFAMVSCPVMASVWYKVTVKSWIRSSVLPIKPSWFASSHAIPERVLSLTLILEIGVVSSFNPSASMEALLP